MLRTLALLFPALWPSWRFFDVIAPSPRIYFRVGLPSVLADWREFTPRPAHVSVTTMLARMLWNAKWNEQLFVTSCAERILDRYTLQAEREMAVRIARRIPGEFFSAGAKLQFKIGIIERQGASIQTADAFVSQFFDFGELR